MSVDSVKQHLVVLNETRARVWNEAKGFLDDIATKHGGEMNAEQREQWTRYNERIDGIDMDIRSIAGREQSESESAVAREAMERQFGAANVARQEAVEADSLRSFLRGETPARPYVDEDGVRGMGFQVDIGPAARRYEAIRAGATAEEVRALAWDTGSVASGVPVITADSLYQYVTASIAAMRMPTYKFTTATGAQMKFPRQNAHSIATQVSGQGTTLAGTDPTYLSMTLDAFKYAELIKVSNEVLQDTGFDIVSHVSQQIGRAIGEVVGTDLVVGTGSGQPNGIMTAITGAGTIATGGSLIDPTYEKLVDLVYSVNGNYRARPSAAFLMRDLTAANIRKLRDGSGGTLGAVLWAPSLTQGIQGAEPGLLLGYPVWTDPNVASLASNAKVVAFGDFSAYWIRTSSNFTFERDDSRYFDTDEVGFRGKVRVDGDCIDTTAINVIKRSV
jgi:HK97 family phage major capsid protein